MAMLTVTFRRTVSATLLAASLTTLSVACGEEQSATGAPPASSPSSAGSPGGAGADGRASGAPAPSGTTPSGTAPSGTAPSGATGTTGTSRVVYFSSSARVVAGKHEVLHDRGDVERFAASVAARDPKTAAAVTASADRTDFSSRVLVGWTASTGCSAATSAALRISGNTLTPTADQPIPPPECLTDFRVTAVFEVLRTRMPEHPVFG